MPLRKVTLLQGVAGNGYTYNAGDVQEIPDTLAEKWVADRVAEYVEGTDEGVAGVDLEIGIAATPAKTARKARSRKAKTSQKR